MKVRVMLLLFFVLSLFSMQALAQTPNVGPVGDESEFAGTQICVDAPVSNTGPPGFGPYFQMIVPIGVTFDSASVFGTGATVIDEGVFPAAPGNELNDSIINEPVTGPEGFQLLLIQLPIGSLVDGAPDLVVELCFTIDPTADIGVPLDITLNPVFEFGDTPTGDNGSILGTPDVFNLTPILVIFEKENDAPEDERPPSSSPTATWPVTYTLTADIAPGATIDLSLIHI